MLDRIMVACDSLNEAADNFLRTENSLEENLSELDSLVESLAESWEGEAHDQFAEYFSQWRSSSRDLHRALRRLRQVTQTAHDNYAAAEAANLSMWGGA